MQLVKTSLLAAIAPLALAVSGAASADIVIDLTTDTTNGTGELLDNSNGVGDAGANISTELPVTVDVYHSPLPLGTSQVGTLVPGLTLTVDSASSFDPADSAINASGATFGVNSPTPPVGSENSARFDVDAAENMTISFNQDVTILSVEFGNFSSEETFSFGGVSIGNSDYTGGVFDQADSSDVFTFSGGGLVVSANTGIFLEAGGLNGTNAASVGIVAITLADIPEPSSLALLGLGGLLIARRRRA